MVKNPHGTWPATEFSSVDRLSLVGLFHGRMQLALLKIPREALRASRNLHSSRKYQCVSIHQVGYANPLAVSG